ncbi:AMIN domain-containing protein, partial [Variovorax sp. LT2P21]|uniref:AMIN domain-containing protein n=1 Tax=Variovorax sp. LT2P21 TaxID=3443731 RepID=UPI003F46A307
KSSLPEGLNRRLDVSDFGTPVQSVSMQQSGDRVRMVIDPRGEWEHSAYQSNSQFVVEVRPRKENPNKLAQGSGYSGEKLSLNFQNIEIRSLLQVIADFTNFNIVTSDSVSGTLTLRLKDVPWDQALEIILEAKNLGMRKSGSVLRIAPEDELNAKEKIKYEAQATLQGLEQLRTQSFQLNYAKAATVAQGLTGTGSSGGGGGSSGSTTRILSSRGSVLAEVRTNQLFVTDIPSRLSQVADLLQKLDVPVRQVLIEARFVEATDTFSKSLGVKLELKLISVAARIPELQQGRVDAVIANLGWSAERAEQIAFSDQYFASEQKVAARKDSGFTTLKDLAGKRVSAVKGSSSEMLVRKVIPGAATVTFQDPPSAFLAMQQ